MSARVTNVVWLNAHARGGALLVLLALADLANDEGCCLPTVGKLAEMTRMSSRAVARHLRVLAMSGEVVREGSILRVPGR